MRAPAKASFVAPMKALGSEFVPEGKWHCEVKFDGYRSVAVVNGGKVELWSRNHKSMTGDYPDVVAALEGLKCTSAVIDGEMVALDAEGRSRFQLLQNRGLSIAPIVYYAFDIMHLDGRDLTDHTLDERTQILSHLVDGRRGALQLSPVFNTDPSELFEVAKERGLEGIVVKRPKSLYESGRRSGSWMKCKVQAEQEVVIGGYTAPQRSRQHFGALLVGYNQGGRLVYAGKVGTGFSDADLACLYEKFQRLRSKACPFANLPEKGRPRYGTGMGAAQMEAVHWLRPSLVAQVRFAEWTDDGLMRQPVFAGLRRDKAPRAVRREPGAVFARP
ncbi:MAG TPA: non-homologous end-joining DNA ligase [Opitutaceae bacterium]|jgi:bifunctional non-homologous end joining protein LigD